MTLVAKLLLGLLVGFALMGLGMWGILVGKTLGATYASRTGDTSEERKAKIYGLIWLLLGFLVVLTVVFKANFVARKGDLGLKREVERNVFRKRDG